MVARTKARKRALDILYAADVGGLPATELLDTAVDDIPTFAREIVRAYGSHAQEIDDVIRTYTDGWPLERMPVVDRNLLRIGLTELLVLKDTPAGVVINEAVELAKMLSTPDSGRFVNGLLGRVARERLLTET